MNIDFFNSYPIITFIAMPIIILGIIYIVNHFLTEKFYLKTTISTILFIVEIYILASYIIYILTYREYNALLVASILPSIFGGLIVSLFVRIALKLMETKPPTQGKTKLEKKIEQRYVIIKDSEGQASILIGSLFTLIFYTIFRIGDPTRYYIMFFILVVLVATIFVLFNALSEIKDEKLQLKSFPLKFLGFNINAPHHKDGFFIIRLIYAACLILFSIIYIQPKNKIIVMPIEISTSDKKNLVNSVEQTNLNDISQMKFKEK